MRVVIFCLMCMVALIAACAPIVQDAQNQTNETNQTQDILIDKVNMTNQTQEETQEENTTQEEDTTDDYRMTGCVESDGGYKVFEKGYAMARGRKMYDICVRDADPENKAYDERTLIEYYCRGDRYLNQKFTCSIGCEDGACIKNEDAIVLYE